MFFQEILKYLCLKMVFTLSRVNETNIYQFILFYCLFCVPEHVRVNFDIHLQFIIFYSRTVGNK